jgi:hypothetical protein
MNEPKNRTVDTEPSELSAQQKGKTLSPEFSEKAKVRKSKDMFTGKDKEGNTVSWEW